jgi:hypothetical protein
MDMILCGSIFSMCFSHDHWCLGLFGITIWEYEQAKHDQTHLQQYKRPVSLLHRNLRCMSFKKTQN